jgi:hypothetical protein
MATETPPPESFTAAEIEQGHKDALDLTTANIFEFLEAKQSIAVCYSCGANAWDVVAPADQGGLATIFHATKLFGNDLTKAPVASYVSLTCMNCGWLRLHSAVRIAVWKRRAQGNRTGDDQLSEAST